MKIICAQLNYTLGDLEGNLEKIAAVIAKHGNTVDLIVFSELCLTGYYPKDLLDQQSFITAHQKQIARLIEMSKTVTAGIIVGGSESSTETQAVLHNTLFLIEQGQLKFSYHKQLLPNYNIFNEARHFQAGTKPGFFEFRGLKLGFMICEDAWFSKASGYTINPIAQMASAVVDLVISINASPSHLGQQKQRLENFKQVAKTIAAPILYVNQVGAHDALVFDGASFALQATGEVVGQLPAFQEAVGLLSVSQGLLSTGTGWQPQVSLTDETLAYEHILLGLRDYVARCQVKEVVVALSGGIDSAVTLAMATVALGASRVSAIFMPSIYTAQQSETDAKHLAQNLGVTCYTYPIQTAFDQAVRDFQSAFGVSPSDLTQQNMQARIRGDMVMSFANQAGRLVLTTGNKSEISVGFTTLYGDMVGGLNLIGDLYKTQVYTLARYYNQQHPMAQIPAAILTRPPSPELAPEQLDSDSLPPYPVLDALLQLHLEGDLLDKRAVKILDETVNTLPQSEKNAIIQRVQRAEFKRQQSCPIIRIQRRAFGQGRQMPIACKARLETEY